MDSVANPKKAVTWSWIRSVIAQGAAIQQDYQAGKYKGYEEYSARLDVAAAEREDEIEPSVPVSVIKSRLKELDGYYGYTVAIVKDHLRRLLSEAKP